MRTVQRCCRSWSPALVALAAMLLMVGGCPGSEADGDASETSPETETGTTNGGATITGSASATGTPTLTAPATDTSDPSTGSGTDTRTGTDTSTGTDTRTSTSTTTGTDTGTGTSTTTGSGTDTSTTTGTDTGGFCAPFDMWGDEQGEQQAWVVTDLDTCTLDGTTSICVAQQAGTTSCGPESEGLECRGGEFTGPDWGYAILDDDTMLLYEFDGCLYSSPGFTRCFPPDFDSGSTGGSTTTTTAGTGGSDPVVEALCACACAID